MTNSKILVNGVRSVLKVVHSSLPEENSQDASELLEHAEWGEALSLICTQLYEYDVVISKKTYDDIEWLGLQMEMSPKEWIMLKELVQ